MVTVKYPKFNTIDPNDFLPLLNKTNIRKHLIKHELFTIVTLTAWMKIKMEVDNTLGCRVRGIVYDGEFAGWCGIQFEVGKYELAIVRDDTVRGLGNTVKFIYIFFIPVLTTSS